MTRNNMAKKTNTQKTPVDLLTQKQAAAEYARLQVEIQQHDKRYYQQDKPTHATPKVLTNCLFITFSQEKNSALVAK